jgi:ribosomal protein L31
MCRHVVASHRQRQNQHSSVRRQLVWYAHSTLGTTLVRLTTRRTVDIPSYSHTLYMGTANILKADPTVSLLTNPMELSAS